MNHRRKSPASLLRGKLSTPPASYDIIHVDDEGIHRYRAGILTTFFHKFGPLDGYTSSARLIGAITCSASSPVYLSCRALHAIRALFALRRYIVHKEQ